MVITVLSVLGLIGCGALNQRQAKQIVDKLSKMYEGETFEVLALGNRFGTATNDTVTAHVRAIERDVVFAVKMNTKGEIEGNNYPARSMNSQLEELLNKNLKDEGISAESLTSGFGITNARSVRNLDPNTSLNEYISKYSPERFAGYLVVKESETNTGNGFINAFSKTFTEIQNIHLQANVWVIPEKSYGEAIEKFSRLPDVSNDWFDDKDTLSYFQFYIDENGEPNMHEDELNNLLRGGE